VADEYVLTTNIQEAIETLKNISGENDSAAAIGMI